MRNVQAQASASAPTSDASTASNNSQNTTASDPTQPSVRKGPWGLNMKYMGKINNNPNNASTPLANALSKGMIGRVIL